ncbi:PA14 domain-containing protein [Crossiella cryophila]|uniref:RHS repeat-associated protein n=1 Tax=Crossiella cryophila TaxID=43355 RepID=A0A7W7C7X6_9PSEU|nr:PA14 domain-containing protein [Crossiella cryophila]MBB4675046.1 RHS repeat-associated protein [Crossiella cryophila]
MTVSITQAVAVAEPEQQATAPRRGTAADLPLPDNKPGELLKPENPKGDFGQPGRAPARSPKPIDPPRPERTGFVEGKSVLVERLPTGNVYRNPDGTRTAKMFQDVVNVKDDRGQLVEVQTDLERKNGKLEPKATLADVQLPEQVGAGADLRVTAQDGATAALEPVDLAIRPATVSGGTAKYAGVQPDVDLQVRILPRGFKHDVVLHRVPQATEWRYRLKPEGNLTPVAEEGGAIALKDPDGKVRLTVPAPVAWDSAINPASGDPAYGPATQRLERDSQGWLLVLSVDRKWLTDKAREFPVTVDPGVTTPAVAEDAYVSDQFPTTNYDQSCGDERGCVNKVGFWPGAGLNETYVKYDLGPARGKQIISSTWHGYWAWTNKPQATPFWLRSVDCGWNARNITWNNKACVGGAVQQAAAQGGAWTDVDISGWMKEYAAGRWNWNGFRLDTNGDRNPDLWKKLAAAEAPAQAKSHLTIHYNDWPQVAEITGPSPVNGQEYRTREFRFGVQIGDPNNDKLYGQVLISEDPNVVPTAFDSDTIERPGGERKAEFGKTFKLDWNKTYYWQVAFRDDWSEWVWSPVWNFRTANRIPAVPGQAAPGERAVVSIKSPELKVTPVTDPDGEGVQYQFAVGTGGSARAGMVAVSGWLDSPQWTIPPGVLKDGVTYHWTVRARDSVSQQETRDAPSRPMKVDMRLGAQGPIAGDTLGPLTVSLATGNVITSLSTPDLTTVGGPISVKMTYNSQASDDAGLVGSYYTGDSEEGIKDTETPVLVRTDPQVSYNWGEGSPYEPVIAKDGFRIRWQGFVRVPTTGDYSFGGVHDDGLRVWVNNQQVYNEWKQWMQPGDAPKLGSALRLEAGKPYPIKVEYRDWNHTGLVHLWAKGAGDPVPVPASWLTPTASALPPGWSLSADVDGQGQSYTKATLTESGVTLTDTDGGSHSYERTSDGGYRPPAGEYGVLSRDNEGKLTLIDSGGTVYVFNASGGLESVTSPSDIRKPAAARMEWRSVDPGNPIPRLKKIIDPVSGRFVELFYGGESGCAPPDGADPVPPGYLCTVRLPDGAASHLYYRGGKLTRLKNPGDELTDLSYTDTHLLTAMRTPQVLDWVLADIDRRNTHESTFVAEYQEGTRSAKALLGPEPSGFKQTPPKRPHHRFGFGADFTEVFIDGTSPATDKARKVIRDSGGRTVTDIDAAGKQTRHEWAEDDKQLSSTDAAGRKSTWVYDAKGNPIEQYGPAPEKCFGADRRPLSPAPAGCEKVPGKRTSYDEGFKGLSSAWWNNAAMSSGASAYSTTEPNGDWTTKAPTEGLTAAGTYSARMSGVVQVDTAGRYTFGTHEDDAADGLRVYVDDELVVDRTYSPSVVESRPLAYWRLGDGNDDLLDASGNGRNGRYEGDVLKQETGALPNDISRSVLFRGGTGRAQVPDSDALDITGPLTLEAWIRPLNNEPGGGWHDLISKYAADSGTPYELVVTPEMQVEFRQGGTGSLQSLKSTGGLRTNRWNHVAVTRDASNKVIFYLNGSKSGEGTIAKSGEPNPLPLTLGRRNVGGTAQSWLDEVAVYDRVLAEKDIAKHVGAAGRVDEPDQSVELSAGPHRIRVDYLQQQRSGNQFRGDSKVNLMWRRGDAALTPVPADKLTPDYGQDTATVEAESDGVPDRRTTTDRAGGGLDLAYGLEGTVTKHTSDGGLTSGTEYEKPGAGFLRRVARSMPSGAKTTYGYYGNTETRDNPCTPEADPAPQAGLAKVVTFPQPASGAARTDEQVYDARGRVVARATGGSWTCTRYDARGRVTEVKFAGNATAGERTVRHDHAVNGDPLVSSVSDLHGTITTTEDLVGRTVAYVDAQGVRTETDYDRAGKVASEKVIPPNPADPPQITTYGYDNAGRAVTVKLGDVQLSEITYDAAGELGSVSYANGAKLAAIGKDGAGRPTSLTWRLGDGREVVSTVSRTRAGTVVDESLGGADARPNGPNYSYDGAGRLTEAWVAGHQYTYDFTSTAAAGCPTGTQSNAGRNTNRVRLLDKTAAGTAETGYCYDAADRLLSTTGANAVSGIKYDVAGNTTEYTAGGAPTYLGWDAAGRNLTARTTGSDPADVAYLRDAENRIIRRDATKGDQTTLVLYGHTSGNDTSDVAISQDKRLVSRSIVLPGGVLHTVPGSGQDKPAAWDHPTIRGDIAATSGPDGKLVGELRTYTPSGEPVKPNGAIDPDHVPDNQPGAMDYGWLGQHQRPYEHAGALSLVQMGARPYSPLLGRFLAVDPLEGGAANDYDYAAADSINKQDLNGQFIGPLLGLAARYVIRPAANLLVRHVVKPAFNWAKDKAVPWVGRQLKRAFSPVQRTLSGIRKKPGRFVYTCFVSIVLAVVPLYVSGARIWLGVLTGVLTCLIKDAPRDAWPR